MALINTIILLIVIVFIPVKVQHRSSLRPALGHPNNAKELSILCEQEADRHQKTLDTINDHLLAIQVIV